MDKLLEWIIVGIITAILAMLGIKYKKEIKETSVKGYNKAKEVSKNTLDKVADNLGYEKKKTGETQRAKVVNAKFK